MKKLMAVFSMVLFLSSFGLTAAQTANVSTTTSAFSDVDSGNLNFDAIQNLKQSGMVQGYSDGTFKPDQTVNRAEFIKMLLASKDTGVSGSNCFSDVGSAWYAGYVCTAKTQGLVSGDAGKNTFRPGDNINFAEAAKIIANFYKLDESGSANVWYQPFVRALSTQNAVPLSVENFDQPVTRAEVAEMIWRVKDDVNNKASRTFDEISGTKATTLASCSALKARFDENSYGGYPGPIMYDKALNVAAPAPMAATTSGAQISTPAAPNYSQTNVQVQGVDEADIVKNDGQFIYTIKGSTVRIVKAFPSSNLAELARFDLTLSDANFYPSELYVDGNQMVVVGSSNQYITPYAVDSGVVAPGAVAAPMAKIASYMPIRGGGQVSVYVVDITDRTAPKVVRNYKFDGSYNTSRKIGNMLYMVMNQYHGFPMYYADPAVTVSTDTTQQTQTTQTVPTATDLLPSFVDSNVGTNQPVTDCNQVLIMPRTNTMNFLIVAAVPLSTDGVVKTKVMLGDIGNVFVSQNNLYVASNDWGGFYGYMPIIQNDSTVINKFSLNGGDVQYVATAHVHGSVVNQYSMDEYNDYFRIATTVQTYGMTETQTSNNVYVLDKNMNQVGKLENFAKGETIYGVRFVADKGYVVTFQQVDPLHIIDLRNPTNPAMAGILTIPGYSAYLHPLAGNYLLGIGKEVDASIDADKVHTSGAVYYTAIQGIKLSIFDVTNVNAPKELFKQVIGGYGTDSQVLYDPKALMIDEATGLLALPVTVYEGPADSSKLTFSGVYLYKIDLQKGLIYLGKVSHLTSDELAALPTSGISDYSKNIDRALYIGDSLYTVSQYMVKSNLLTDLSKENSIVLAQ